MNGHALHKLVAGLVRRTWLLALLATLACAAFAATAVASLVEASYLEPAPHAAPLPSRVTMDTVPAQKVRPDGNGFVVRNMFCSTCTPLQDGPGLADAFSPQAILIATSVGAEPRATVRALTSDAQGSYGIGDTIPTVGKVDRISWRSIDVLDASGRRGRLNLLDDAASRGPGAATPDPAAAADPLAGRIKKIDDHTFEVERELVRDLVSGSVKPNGLRITPISDKGELKGLRLFGVRPGSVAGSLGLQNGDTLTTINNNQIKSAQTLLDVYAQMDTLNVVELDGTRAGKPLGITLRLR